MRRITRDTPILTSIYSSHFSFPWQLAVCSLFSSDPLIFSLCILRPTHKNYSNKLSFSLFRSLKLLVPFVLYCAHLITMGYEHKHSFSPAATDALFILNSIKSQFYRQINVHFTLHSCAVMAHPPQKKTKKRKRCKYNMKEDTVAWVSVTWMSAYAFVNVLLHTWAPRSIRANMPGFLSYFVFQGERSKHNSLWTLCNSHRVTSTAKYCLSTQLWSAFFFLQSISPHVAGDVSSQLPHALPCSFSEAHL